ncbi:MAG TPA: BolA/IbaG family iron-sulfur metabolism protein [Bacteriovoracaceae bacterium]|nr:BolA/IbaG family iron-sulfur metabolism protein [Bacteriovoracaceae bacterium]
MNTGFEFVEEIIKSGLPDAQVMVEDMTGTRDHLAITVVSDAFKGKLLIEQHQLLMNLLKEELKSRIHAVKLQTYTKEKFEQSKKG